MSGSNELYEYKYLFLYKVPLRECDQLEIPGVSQAEQGEHSRNVFLLFCNSYSPGTTGQVTRQVTPTSST